MATLEEMFPSKTMKAGVDVIEGKNLVGVITRIDMEEFKDNGRTVMKPVLFLRGQKKGFVCNKTNASIIAKLYGNDTDDWIGKAIELYATEVQFQSDMVPSIRVKSREPKMPARTPAAAPGHAPARTRPGVNPDGEPGDDEIGTDPDDEDLVF